VTLLVFACAQPEQKQRVDTERGRALIAQYGCNVCHTIPGISGPQGSIGPTLQGVASRPTISQDTVKNTPENLEKFIQRPMSMNPHSNMPGLDVTAEDAHEIAAYLQTLR
jgi:cytochrome c2